MQLALPPLMLHATTAPSWGVNIHRHVAGADNCLEIHDGIAQSVYMLALNLEKAADVANSDPALRERLGRLVGLAKETLMEVRHYICDLKPLLSGDAGLRSTIEGQLREFSTVSGLPVHLSVEGEERKVPLAVGSSLYRIAQEALANVFRHSCATDVKVCLYFNDGSVSMRVQDNGRGFDVEGASGSGRGLRNMRQRVMELGGEFAVFSAPGRGASVRVMYSSDREYRDNPSPDTCLTANLQTTTRLLRAFSHRPKAKMSWEIAGSIEAPAIVRNLELQPSTCRREYDAHLRRLAVFDDVGW